MPRFTHKPTGYNTNPNADRMVFVDGQPLCRVVQSVEHAGGWMFQTECFGFGGCCHCPSLNTAMQIIKALYLTYGKHDYLQASSAPQLTISHVGRR